MARLNSGKTAVLISHDAATIRRLCSRAIWIENGVSVASGESEIIGRQYEETMAR
jgi:lipopolysaccharide transport system ATP-binding protein